MSKNKRPKAVSRTSDPNNKKNQAKELALLETLQDAESRQLESFIKSRSQELDADIKAMRHKLKIPDDSIENDSLKARVAAVNLNVTGVGLGRVEFNTDNFSQNVTKLKNSIPEFKLDPSKNSIQPKTVKDHLVLFLAKIKISKHNISLHWHAYQTCHQLFCFYCN